MCGIAGFSGAFAPDLLPRMGHLISHRGPDDAGTLYLASEERSIGLAHQRLSIIDLSAHGRQPMTTSCSCCGSDTAINNKLWLIYNGELYNYKELRTELIAQGHQFYSETDSEVLLHLYAQCGANMLQKLNGIFAFALYDGRINGQHDGMQPGDLLLARDGFGVKPLYYTQVKSGFLFASELKALLACSEVKRVINPVAIHYHLTYLWCPAPDTAMAGINKLEPGQAMIVRQQKIAKQWFFYDLPYGQTFTGKTQNEVAAELAMQLENAVKRQMIADVPIGAFLSGGLDSSAIVAMMRKIEPHQPFPCYSIGFANNSDLDGSPADLPYARTVAKHLNVDLRVLEVNADMINNLERMLYYLDEPQADPAPINALLIAEAARNDGIKVLMSGVGGDDIFSGYRRHRAIAQEYLWTWLPLFVRKKMATATSYFNKNISFTRRLAKLMAHVDQPQDRRIMQAFFWSTESMRQSLYSSNMKEAIGSLQAEEPLMRSLLRIPNESNSLNRMLYLEAKHFLADHNLNYTDKVSMAAGVEVRVPLLDNDLVKFATSIPANMKQQGSVGKAIFKKAMEPYLPRNIIYRPKTGFGAPLRRWLHKELKPLTDELLSESTVKARGLFMPQEVRRLMNMDKAGQVDAAYVIFALLCTEIWCRQFIDKPIT